MTAQTTVSRLERPGRAPSIDSRADILAAAAECFKGKGFSATSIDDVAHRLGATKGMIYHHFRSKTDLFFAVYRRGMEINFESVQPHSSTGGSAVERLARMGYAHAITMMAEQAFQRTQHQGVTMHLTGATTAAQRETLTELIEIRDRYEAMFRHAIEAAGKECNAPVGDPSIAVKNFLSVLNATVFWYSPREKNPAEEQHTIAAEVVSYALKGLGIEPPELREGARQ